MTKIKKDVRRDRNDSARYKQANRNKWNNVDDSKTRADIDLKRDTRADIDLKREAVGNVKQIVNHQDKQEEPVDFMTQEEDSPRKKGEKVKKGC